MRKLTVRERLDSWRDCGRWRCEQCPHYSRLDREEEERLGGYDGWCDMGDGHVVYFDDDCAGHDCGGCDGDGRCALQAKTARFVGELDLLWAGAETDDIPLFESLVAREIMWTLAKWCPHFARRKDQG